MLSDLFSEVNLELPATDEEIEAQRGYIHWLGHTVKPSQGSKAWAISYVPHLPKEPALTPHPFNPIESKALASKLSSWNNKKQSV